MAVLASAILTRVRTQLIDSGATRWPDSELLKWLSDGQRAIVKLVPSASAKRATVPLAAGTLQALPDDAYMLLSVERNNVSDGGTPGRAVRIISRELLDAFDPDWHTATRKKVAQNYAFDPNTPREYFVQPPNDGTGFVDVVYSELPADVDADTDTLTVHDIYQTELVDYVLYRAYEKDADFAAGQAYASTYYQKFTAALGGTEEGTVAANPNLSLSPPDMSNKGSAK